MEDWEARLTLLSKLGAALGRVDSIYSVCRIRSQGDRRVDDTIISRGIKRRTDTLLSAQAPRRKQVFLTVAPRGADFRTGQVISGGKIALTRGSAGLNVLPLSAQLNNYISTYSIDIDPIGNSRGLLTGCRLNRVGASRIDSVGGERLTTDWRSKLSDDLSSCRLPERGCKGHTDKKCEEYEGETHGDVE